MCKAQSFCDKYLRESWDGLTRHVQLMQHPTTDGATSLPYFDGWMHTFDDRSQILEQHVNGYDIIVMRPETVDLLHEQSVQVIGKIRLPYDGRVPEKPMRHPVNSMGLRYVSEEVGFVDEDEEYV